jgi:anionic cell wall polymer biosynthesis LytR-Cps2A-Psr (LCP) family protein
MGKEALAKQTVSELLKTGIHGIITVDPKGLIKLVDSLGGVNLYVEKNMKYDDNWGDLHIDLKKGRQKLSGKDFEGYVRFRHDSDGDVARVQRQQTALRQVLKKLSSPAALVRLPWMIPALKTAVKTDISFPDLLRIANFSRTLDPSNIRTFTLPGYTKEGDPHWYVDLEQTHKVLQENKII